MIGASGYSIVDYGGMIDCEPRMGIYAQALERAISPGCTVIDIGAGFGVFALLACQYGAGRVIAIEPDSSIELLRELARDNGCADRIEVVRDISTNFTPERKADVIVSDLRGNVSLFGGHIPTIVDARERLLADNGSLLPMRDTLRIALVHTPKEYRTCHRPWLENDYGIDLSAGHRFAVNDSDKVFLDPEALVSEAAELATLDYRTICDPNLDQTLKLVAALGSTVHGLLLWFDAEIAEGLTYSNAPGQPHLVYEQKFLPFERPIDLKAGDRVEARIRARLVDNQYIWSWDSVATAAQDDAQIAAFRQSSFKSRIFVPDHLASISSRHVPAATAAIAIDRDCLALVGEGRDLETIAKALIDRHPAHFASLQAALDHVAKLMLRYA
ncbi:50S ribosomal protein L11 methyltransferase [Erythrobacter sp. JK5]|uniref:50S ribosomal protein L11 methyltransferase n=1 Tax=Erythrobacter sp. JK5 TaxID=2829500 RepID=UPI001BAAECF7|nr:50S ribosomal protein L11 methyltransferase [Erythrobacter sp. JK5]QUL37654.1 50S ribosomal protein L11 methyltransferase [Erythrobacter sp. JK5]